MRYAIGVIKLQEISLNILDVAENGVKAGATLVSITVDEQPDQDLLTVIIEDNGCGMTEEQLQQVTDPFFTSRTTRKVGLGIPLIKMAAEMTGGTLTIGSTVGVGTKVTARFGYHHIDRMPLGNTVDTITALVQCNPHMDFVYTRVHGDKTFVMDTREFRAVLGDDISLAEPEVVQYIRAFLDEGEQSVI